MKKICKECGCEFTLPQGEIDFYKSKNLSLPARCKPCRDKRKSGKSVEKSHNIPRNTVNHSRNQMDFDKPYVQQHTTATKWSSLDSSLLMKFILPVIFCILALLLGRTLPSNQVVDTSSAPNTSVGSTYSPSVTFSGYSFRNDQYLVEHFNKHGSLLGYFTKESYLEGANAVIKNTTALKRTQADGDTAYYVQSSNEFVVLSTDGYIRTYFKPTDGIDYFYRQ